MTSSSPETQVSEFVTTVTYDDLPKGVAETITRAFVDTVGVMVAGTAENAGRVVTEVDGIEPVTTDTATLLGINTTSSPEYAALRAGTAGHALDYDDLSWAMDGHPSVTLIPALLPLVDQSDATGRDLITAYAAGFEAECAIAEPISPDHYEAGWHATATFGTFGAAAAAANLLGLSADATSRALNIAASMPSGLKRNFGSMTKPLHAGLCSRSGVTAARLASEGFTADAVAVSGDRGFWDLYGTSDRERFSIGDSWALQEEGIHIKAYPCCYFTHSAIAATQALMKDIDPDAIEHIAVKASPGAGDALVHADPNTGLEAKFSMEYAVASATVRERVGLSAFRKNAVDDPDVQRIRDRVDFSVDDDLAYDSHESTVRIMADDETYERRQENPPGTHDDPLTEAELQAKFEECAGAVLPNQEVNRLYEVLSSLPSQSDISSALLGNR